MATIPAFSLPGSDGTTYSDTSLRGVPFVLYCYPKDLTSGCTVEACDFRDAQPAFAKLGVKTFGLSPDPVARHLKFIAKESLNFVLLADEQHVLAAALGVWTEKSMYGRKYFGIERSTFLVDRAGAIRKEWRKVKVAGHVAAVQAALAELG